MFSAQVRKVYHKLIGYCCSGLSRKWIWLCRLKCDAAVKPVWCCSQTRLQLKLVWDLLQWVMKVPQSSGNPHHFTLATTSLCQCSIRIMHIHRETATSPDVWPPLWTSLWFTVSPGCGHIWCWKWTTSLQENSSAHYSRRCRQATWNPPGCKPVWASSSASTLSPKLRCLWWEHPSWST